MAFLRAPVISTRSTGIDIVRTFLALWVVAIHLIPAAEIAAPGSAPGFAHWIVAKLDWIFQPRAETHPAVLIFIVLSGYCIHRNGFREGDVDLSAFAIRRFFRIYPVYLLAVPLGLVVLFWAYHAAPTVAPWITGTQATDGACLSAKLIGLPALLPEFYRCSLLGNTPLSTVVVEIYLYAAYPVLLLGISPKLGDRVVWGVVVLLWAAQLLAVVINPDLAWWWHNSSLLGFLLYWWIGAKLVEADLVEKLARYATPLIGLWIAMSLVLMKLLPTGNLLLLVEARKLVFAILAGMLISIVDRRQFTVNLELGPFIKSGYSLYAIHAPILTALLIMGVPWWLTGAIAVVAGVICYAAVEAPMLRWGRKLALKRRIAPLP